MKGFLSAAGITLLIAALSLPLFYGGLFIWGVWWDEWSGFNASISVSDGVCNIAVIPINGDITTFGVEEGDIYYASADAVVGSLRAAEQDPNIIGALARIDSYGGLPVASEMIANAFRNSHLPIAGLIREAGTSGGYLVAAGSDMVIASSFSDVGGIGISMSYLENTAQNEGAGLSYVELTSAPYKDYGSPDRPLTAEERAILERDLAIYHDHFTELIAHYRGLSIEEVRRLADGASVPGKLALEQGLIDELGDQETARQWFAHVLDSAPEDIVFCE